MSCSHPIQLHCWPAAQPLQQLPAQCRFRMLQSALRNDHCCGVSHWATSATLHICTRLNPQQTCDYHAWPRPQVRRRCPGSRCSCCCGPAAAAHANRDHCPAPHHLTAPATQCSNASCHASWVGSCQLVAWPALPLPLTAVPQPIIRSYSPILMPPVLPIEPTVPEALAAAALSGTGRESAIGPMLAARQQHPQCELYCGFMVYSDSSGTAFCDKYAADHVAFSGLFAAECIRIVVALRGMAR
jgi:hypothetical protein